MEEVQQLILWRQKIEDFRGIFGPAAALGRSPEPTEGRDSRRNPRYDRVRSCE